MRNTCLAAPCCALVAPGSTHGPEWHLGGGVGGIRSGQGRGTRVPDSSRRREDGLKSAYAAGASGQMDLIRDERDAGFPQRPGVFVSEAGQGLPTPAPPGARAGHHSGRIMAPVMTAQDRSLIDLSGDSTVQDRSAFVSVAEAARRLGVSTATVKRRIRDGTLEAEPLSRPQGIRATAQ